MNDIPRSNPPLCAIRLDAAAHLAAVEGVARDCRVSRASHRSVDQRRARQLRDVLGRLQSAHIAAQRPDCRAAGSTPPPPAAPAGELPGSARAAPSHLPPTGSLRRPRLRLYTPISPV